MPASSQPQAPPVLKPPCLRTAGGPYSGAALNPARVFGPSLVFHCYWSTVPVYIFAQLLGAAAAAGLTMPLYGFGPWIAAAAVPDAEASISIFRVVLRYP